MYDQGVVIGRVIGVQAGGPKSELLIVEDRSRPDYPNRVACEFYEKQRSQIEGVANGQLVRVVGSIKSREYNGKWYTSFSAFQLTSLAHLDAKSGGLPANGAGSQESRIVGEDDGAF